MKNLLLTSTLLSVLITSDVATARTQAAPSIALMPVVLSISQAGYQIPPGASPHAPEPGLGEPAPHVLLAVAVGLLLLRMGSRRRSEKFTN